MTKREANKLLSYYCPFIKKQFKKEFVRFESAISKGHIYYMSAGGMLIETINEMQALMTFIQNIRTAAIDCNRANRR